MNLAVNIFLRLLVRRPHRAAAIAYWYVTGRRTRAHNRLRQTAADELKYSSLALLHERRGKAAAAAPDTIAQWDRHPAFSIIAVTPGDVDIAWVNAAIRSAIAQSYGRWELLLVGAGGAAPTMPSDDRIRRVAGAVTGAGDPLAKGIEAARGDFVVPLSPGVELAPTALFHFAEALQASPEAALLYGDEDRIDPRGRRAMPWFKPAWNGELILALDYVSRACAIAATTARRSAAAVAAASGCPVYALLLEATGEGSQAIHVPHIVAHIGPAAIVDDQAARVATVAARLAPHRAAAEPGPFGTVTVRWPLPEPEPSVTVFVPTRDKVSLLKACVDSVLARTVFDNFALKIIDNGSIEPATKQYFAYAMQDRRVTVISCAMPYNFSAINNFAVAHTSGDYLCFLNNDTEIIDGAWLGEMMRYAVRPHVGAVGAKLLYADGSIQHAGVVTGLGDAAGHAHRGLAAGQAGYFAMAHAAHYASAVTAACLVVDRAKFLAVGGFDAAHLAIAYNDVDLCLKLQAAGWRNVYAPQAVLYHHESKSRGSDLSPAHIDRYFAELSVLQRRWHTRTAIDPMHHPRLDRASETYRMSF